ncbi:MAG: hypothetical protein VB858_17980 [Planctomycetaceae bacterium]
MEVGLRLETGKDWSCTPQLHAEKGLPGRVPVSQAFSHAAKYRVRPLTHN